MKVLVLGAGKMVEAILLGLLKKEDLSHWGIYSPSGSSAKRLAEKTGSHFVDSFENLSPEWILVGCKPQQLHGLKETLHGRFTDALYISLIAAVSEEHQRDLLGVKRLIRVMPNLNVKYGEGVTLLSSQSAESDIVEVHALFSKLGSTPIVKEHELEELTLLTGSGPALFYEFTKQLAECFSSLDPALREGLARQVLKGAGLNASNEPFALEDMINAVTSKGGVTIAVLEKWRSEKLGETLKKGIERGLERTMEIKEDLLKDC